jgi:hypothetical protein
MGSYLSAKKSANFRGAAYRLRCVATRNSSGATAAPDRRTLPLAGAGTIRYDGRTNCSARQNAEPGDVGDDERR